jgi:hypothetical protein
MTTGCPTRVSLSSWRSEDDTHFSGRFAFTVSVNSVDIIRDKPIVMVLEGAVDSINGLLTSTEAICQRLGFFERPQR